MCKYWIEFLHTFATEQTLPFSGCMRLQCVGLRTMVFGHLYGCASGIRTLGGALPQPLLSMILQSRAISVGSVEADGSVASKSKLSPAPPIPQAAGATSSPQTSSQRSCGIRAGIASKGPSVRELSRCRDAARAKTCKDVEDTQSAASATAQSLSSLSPKLRRDIDMTTTVLISTHHGLCL